MRRLRIGPRLTLSFAIIILLMFLGTAVGLWQFTVVQTQADLVTDAIADEQAAALANMHQAQQQAYNRVREISWANLYYRTDIGYRAVNRESEQEG